MDSKNADILQIKKYLEGKLDARAMYELERRALDDPFLMDAMEGYEAVGNQNAAVTELSAALKSRLQRPKARVISLTRVAAAASVITILGIGGWWIFSRPVATSDQTFAKTEADKTLLAPSPLVNEPQISIQKDSLLAVTKPRAVIRSPRRTYYNGSVADGYDVPVTSDETSEIASSAARYSLNELAISNENVRTAKDSVPFNEMVVMGFGRQKKAEMAGAVSESLKAQLNSASKVGAIVVSTTIKGKVTDESGQPLPGVTVRAGNSADPSFTDKDGLYSLKLDSTNTNITYNYPGFRARQLSATSSALSNTITLEPETTSLNEVVVVNNGKANADGVQPKSGWENFQKYLNTNSVSPNGKAKSYRVSFTVEKDGSLSNFELAKAENDLAGQKAIQLIKNGPEWVGNPQGQPKKITVTVKFHKPEEKK